MVKVPIPAAGRQYKVLHGIANFMIGGSSRLVVDLIEGLGGGYAHRILTRFDPTPTAFVSVTISALKIEASAREFSRCSSGVDEDLFYFHYLGGSAQLCSRRECPEVRGGRISVGADGMLCVAS